MPLFQCLEAVYSSDRVSEEVVMSVEETLRTAPEVQKMFLQVRERETAVCRCKNLYICMYKYVVCMYVSLNIVTFNTSDYVFPITFLSSTILVCSVFASLKTGDKGETSSFDGTYPVYLLHGRGSARRTQGARLLLSCRVASCAPLYGCVPPQHPSLRLSLSRQFFFVYGDVFWKQQALSQPLGFRFITLLFLHGINPKKKRCLDAI